MRRWGCAFAALLVCSLMSGCWLQPGYDAGRTGWNAGETKVTSANVGQLVQIWEHQIGDILSVLPPVSYGGAVYAVSGDGRAAAIDGKTGQIKWSRTLIEGGTIHTPSLVYHDGLVLVPYQFNQPNAPIGGGIISLDPRTGETVGDDQGDAVLGIADAKGSLAVRTRFIETSPVGPALVEAIDWLYTPTLAYQPSSNVYPRDFAIVGDRIVWSIGPAVLGFSAACPPNLSIGGGCGNDWITTLDPSLNATALGPVAVDNDSAVVVTDRGSVVTINIVTGAVEWTADAGDVVRFAAPAVADGKILVATDAGRLEVFAAQGCGAPTCSPLWQGTIGPPLSGPARTPVAAGDLVYASYNGEIAVFALGGCRATTCGRLATLTPAGNSPDSDLESPVVDDGRVIVGTSDGHVIAFGLANL